MLIESSPNLSIIPNQAINKTWRVKNTGTTAWNGFKLIFTGGDKMGGVTKELLPLAANGTMDIILPLKAPATPGRYRGSWQIVNRDGVYVPGGNLSVEINVVSAATGGGRIVSFTADPASPSNASQIVFTARINWWQQYRAMRVKVGDQVIGETSATEGTFRWEAGAVPRGDHTVMLEVASQTDTSWSNPERQVMVYTLNGTATPANHKPNRPNPREPYNWFVYYAGNTARLCGQANGDPDNDAITHYQFEIFDSAEGWNSGWVTGDCATTRAMGPHNYQWRVKVRDSRGAESDWSEPWHFTLVNPNLSITQLEFQPQDSNSEVVKIRACTAGQGGVNITMRVSVNDATDGSGNGQWHIIKEQGSPCFNDNDAPIWRTLPYGNGTHLVRVEARGLDPNWNGATVREGTYTLPQRRPAEPSLLAPLPAGETNDVLYRNTRQLIFRWSPALRSQNYKLFVSTTPTPKDNPNVVNQTVSGGTTEQTITFNQDYPLLYWQVQALNDTGVIESITRRIGIDRQAPTCTVQPLNSPVWESIFQVNWSGNDNMSGIRSYDLQVQDLAQGEWQDWQSNVPSTKSFDLFTGQPGHRYAFRCRTVDNAGNLGTYPNSADTTVLIDLTARPTTPWWHAAYSQKRNLIIQNNTPNSTIPNFYPIRLHFDQTTVPTAAELYNASLSTPKCNDLRVIYHNSVALDRVVTTCSSSSIDIWFRAQDSIHSSTPNSGQHQLYYGNPNPGTPPANASKIWPDADAGDIRAYIAMQEGSSNTAADLSAYSNHCTFDPATIQWSPNNKFGAWALQLNNPPSGSALVCGSNGLNTASFTAETWINYAADGWFLSNMSGGSEQERWIFRIVGDRLGVMIYQGGGSSDIDSGVGVPKDTWHHVAVTFDGDRTINFYLDGVLRATRTKGNSGIRAKVVPLRIGAVEGHGRLRGRMAFVKVSNGVATTFPAGYFAQITNEPTTAVGAAITPPATGSADLAVLSINSYPAPSGGILIETIVKNQGSLSTGNGFYTDLYVDHAPSGPGDTTGRIEQWVAGAIAAGKSLTLTTLLVDGQQAMALNEQAVAAMTERTKTIYIQTDAAGVVGEAQEANNIGLPVQVCFASPDSYENDSDRANAKPLGLNSLQTHNLHLVNDQDWYRFTAQAGSTYSLATSNLGSSADTYLYLYGTDGSTLLASNDDSGESLSSRIDWNAPGNGTYYLLVKHWNANVAGCGTSYDILMSIVTPPTPTPTFTYTRIPATNTPIPTATFTRTPVPPTWTNTPIPTATFTRTPVPPTWTNTPIPINTPTWTPTNTPTPTPIPITPIPSNSGELINSWEAGAGTWHVNGGAQSAVVVAQYASEGSKSVKLAFTNNPGWSHFQYNFPATLDLSGYGKLQLHVINPGTPLTIKVSVPTGPNWAWHVSPGQSVPFGSKLVEFDLRANNWTIESNTGPIANLNQAQGLVILIEGAQTPNALYVDNLRKLPAPAANVIYLSLSANTTINGVKYGDEDVLAFNQSTGTWSLVLDGSDIGLTKLDIDAVERQTDGSYLLSVDKDGTLPGGLAVGDEDIVRFAPTSLGSVTAGNFSLYFDGSDVELTTSAEDVDAFTTLEDGRLLISTLGNAKVTGVTKSQDKDILVFTPSTLEPATAGTWALYFDGSNVGLDSAKEDIWGVNVGPNNMIYLTTLGAFAVNGVSGDGADIFLCTASSLGATTACSFSLYWDGSAFGLSGKSIDAFDIVSTAAAQNEVLTTTAEAAESAAETDDDELNGNAEDDAEQATNPEEAENTENETQIFLPLIAN